MTRRGGKPSPAMVVALLALFVALGGAAYAVTKAPKNSVVSKSIKNGQVKGVDIKDKQVKGSDLGAGTTIVGATFQELPVGASQGTTRAPIGPSGAGDWDEIYAPVDMVVSDFRAQGSPSPAGASQSFIVQVLAASGASRNTVGCVIVAPAQQCNSAQQPGFAPLSASIRAGERFRILITNGGVGSFFPKGGVSYTLKPK